MLEELGSKVIMFEGLEMIVWGLGAMIAIQGGVAEWLRQGPAKPCTPVRFRSPPLVRRELYWSTWRAWPGSGVPKVGVSMQDGLCWKYKGVGDREFEDYQAATAYIDWVDLVCGGRDHISYRGPARKCESWLG